MSAPHGILLVDKAPDRTSHDVVARVRWLLHTKKVGHAGTLDPMATGLLVLGIGQGTRLLTHLVGLSKTYTATIRLGRGTTTDDREGEALGELVDASGIAPEALEAALASLRGPILQVPSTVSAIKIDGKRAYARARAGEQVELAARPITVSRFEVRARRSEGPFLDLDVVVGCTSGTYVRALARDLGAALGVGGHLTALRRRAVGPFDVADAVHVPSRGEAEDAAVALPLRGLGAVASQVMPSLVLDEEAARDLGHGKQVPVPDGAPAQEAGGEDPRWAALDTRSRLLGIVAPAQGAAVLQPVLVVPPEARC
ncbi:tRNA pseudouridine(55) synthase TruB [Brachybacterium hainanense]|uniref:tRNA pseudouridine synthase B n=1 Tax=Brachybacterium hainanense TaxID=1541174 RepID=A0ABV6REV0_9MICO